MVLDKQHSEESSGKTLTYDTWGNPAVGLCYNPFWKYIFLFFFSVSWTAQKISASHFLSRSSFSLPSLVRDKFSAISLPRRNRHLTVFWLIPKNHTKLVASFFLDLVSFFSVAIIQWPSLAFLTSNYRKHLFSSHFHPEKSKQLSSTTQPLCFGIFPVVTDYHVVFSVCLWAVSTLSEFLLIFSNEQTLSQSCVL